MAFAHHDEVAPELLTQEQTAINSQQYAHSDAPTHQSTRNSIEAPAPESTCSESDHVEPISRHGTQTMIDDQDRSELVRIATALSRRRSSLAAQPRHSQHLESVDENDPAINPEHRDFDLEKWLRRFMDQSTEGGLKDRSTGVSYRNLDVFGSGSALQLQDTVGSVLTAPLKLGEFFSFHKKQRKQIIHGFDGLLNAGELLIVLGRPGSGCSTLLKTVCGELDGLELGEQTKIHYNGVSQKHMIKEFKGETIYNQEVRHSKFRLQHKAVY